RVHAFTRSGLRGQRIPRGAAALGGGLSHRKRQKCGGDGGGLLEVHAGVVPGSVKVETALGTEFGHDWARRDTYGVIVKHSLGSAAPLCRKADVDEPPEDDREGEFAP